MERVVSDVLFDFSVKPRLSSEHGNAILGFEAQKTRGHPEADAAKLGAIFLQREVMVAARGEFRAGDEFPGDAGRITPAEQGPGWQLGSAVLSFLAQLVVIGALTYGVLESLRGGRPPVGALFGTGFRKMGWVFATSFRVGLWMLLGFVLLVVPAFMWYSALFVAVPAVVAEPNLPSSADALERSRALTKGSRWGIFAVVLVAFAVGFASSAIAAVLGALAGALPHPIPVLLATVLTALASSYSACAAAVAYHDLRVAKEGVATADLVKVFE